MSYRSSALWTSEVVLTPERKLWRGVLEQAYADAELLAGIESVDEPFTEQIRARLFLRAGTPEEKEGLRLVCDYAEVPCGRLVTWARKHYVPPTKRDLKKLKARDAREAEEIAKAILDRKAATLAPSKLRGSLVPLLHSSALLQ